MNPLDLSILTFLNQFAQRSPRFDECVAFLSDSNLLKGGVIVGMMWWVWFGNEDVRRKREVLLATLIASIPALIIAKTLTVVTFRVRPLNEPRLALRIPHTVTQTDWQQFSSFPSDHAVLFFAIAVGILIASRRAGWFALFYVSAFICLPRMYLGEHYATDILTGAAIGVIPVCLANLPRIRHPLTCWALRWLDASPSSFYFLASLALYQVVELFDPLIEMGKFIHRLA
jgi:undecaprenyl-diphosphatase